VWNDGQIGKRTDRQDEANGAFRNFAIAPKNDKWLEKISYT
jgi:hypothetical protein